MKKIIPLVSILIPLYNAEKYVHDCLGSVLNQTYKNLEVIIVDDGSIDGSLAIVKQYETLHKEIKVYSQQNSGASAARNKAFSFAQGEYIQYLDADDYLHPDKIWMQMQKLGKGDSTALCFGKCDYFQGENKNILHRHLTIYDKNHSASCTFLYTMWLNAEALPPLAYLTHRSLIETSGGWNEELTTNDDGEFFARVIVLSRDIMFVSESISYYRMDTPDSLSKQISYKSLLSLIQSITLYAEHSKKCKQDFTEALRTIYTVTIIKLYPLDVELAKKVEVEKRQLGIIGFRYPKRTKVYDLLFAILGIRITATLHKELLNARDFIYEIKAGNKVK